MQTFTLKIINIIKETEDTITLYFKQPGLKKVKYLAGQYLTLVFRINGRRYIRPYSFSSAPKVDNTLNVTIKRVQNGIVSNHIHDMVKVDDLVEVMSPMGDFILPENRNYSSVLLWGAGSGITPLMSIAKTILHNNHEQKVFLIYGNKDEKSTIFHDDISSFEKNHPSRFKSLHFHTKLKVVGEIPNLVQGRIDPKKVLEIFKKTEDLNSIHFICGPNGLKQSVKETLLRHGVMENNIFFEDFELVKDPKDFADIETRTIRLIFNGSEKKLEIAKGKSILEVALDAGLELPYSCQTGNCSTCKATLKRGSLKMIGLNEERKDLAKNEFLLCCSYPWDEDVCVEI